MERRLCLRVNRNLMAGLLMLLCASYTGVVSAKETITVCSDNNFWYPFTMVEDGKAVGVHVEIISRALSNLGYDVEFKPLPWRRCLLQGKSGVVDAVATASYKPDRAEYLQYPDDAATAKTSVHRVTQVEYVVVTNAHDAYEYQGDIKTIPMPVRAPRGYSIVSDLKAQGLKVDSRSAGDEANLQKLLREQNGSIVTIPEVIRQLEQRSDYKGKVNISTRPVKSKSYFLPFSKKSKLSQVQVAAIWAEVSKIREDHALVAEIVSKY